jgi:hypothetical protein
MRPRLAALMAIAVAGLVMVGGNGVAAAASPALHTTQEEINAILAEHPDAVQTGKDTVTFSNGIVRKVGITSEEQCPGDTICLWDDQNFTGQMDIVYSYVCDYGLVQNLKDTGFNDRASSWKNNTTRRVATTYFDYDAGGLLWRMFPQQKGPTLPAEFNDEASAVTCTNLF